MSWIGQTSLAPGIPLSTVSKIGACAIALGILAGWFYERRRVNRIHSGRAGEIARIEQAQQQLRTKGDASETLVGNTLLALAQQFDPTASLGNGMVMHYPQSRPGQMSRFEIDNLLITRFGVFLVEVKHWKNPITISASGWAIEKPSGTEPVSSPLEQSAPKHRVLTQAVNQTCTHAAGLPVESIVVLSHPQARFSLHAPAQVLVLSDLGYYLRLAYLRALGNGLPSVHDVKRAKYAIDEMHDKDPTAKHHFLLELAAKKGFSLDYLELDQARQAIVNLPYLRPRPIWRSWATYLASTLVAGAIGTMQMQLGHTEITPPPSAPLSAAASASATASTTSDIASPTSPVTQPKKKH
jgi:hypothetical protein